jgi:LacI family transcriptional regulator
VTRLPVSIKEVAARASVSVGTVSNVLNRPELVAQATLARVNAAIAELGFVRNEAARQLRMGRSRTIGLVVLDVANPFFTDLARGVEDEASLADLAVILCNSDDQERKECRYLDLLEEHRVQGVLITPVTSGGRSRLAKLQSGGTPVVLVDSMPLSAGHCSVAVDDVLGGDIAVSHLLACGHDRIACIGGPEDLRQAADRQTGAARAMLRAGRDPLNMTVIRSDRLNVPSGQRAGAEWLSLPPRRRPTAVFAVNDLIALGFLEEVTRHGLRVPGDVAVVGYDDIDFAAAAAVPLTSVRQPRRQLGRTAARLLLEETAGGAHQHRQVIYQPELIIRQSSQLPPPLDATGHGGVSPLWRRLIRGAQILDRSVVVDTGPLPYGGEWDSTVALGAHERHAHAGAA